MCEKIRIKRRSGQVVATEGFQDAISLEEGGIWVIGEVDREEEEASEEEEGKEGQVMVDEQENKKEEGDDEEEAKKAE